MKNPPAAAPRKQRRTEDHTLAKRYNVTDRTVRAWRSEGAPVDSPTALDRWLADNRSHVTRQADALPPGLEHSNILRHFVEDAASHFLYEAASTTLDNLISSLVEEEGMDAKKARGIGIVVWYGLLHQLSHWTTSDRYNRHLMEGGASLDSALKAVLPGWKERSAPPSELPRQPVPACIQAAFQAAGQPVRRFVRLDPKHGLAFSD